MTKEKANRNEVVGMFLTYCRKTLVNARTDVLRERKRRRNREVLFCDLRRSELESLADWQDVPERETVFDAAGKPIGVTDKDLADALEKLCPEEQAIILLSYFAGWSDRRIGEDMGFPRSTVQNRRARALARLADILTEGGDPRGKGKDCLRYRRCRDKRRCPCCRGGARLLQRLHGRTLHRVLHRRGWLLGLRHRPLDEIVYAGEALACDVEVSAVKDATCNK